MNVGRYLEAIMQTSTNGNRALDSPDAEGDSFGECLVGSRKIKTSGLSFSEKLIQFRWVLVPKTNGNSAKRTEKPHFTCTCVYKLPLFLDGYYMVFSEST